MGNKNLINQFTNKYNLSKTLKFRLIPVGETLENILNSTSSVLEEDKTRSNDYKELKKIVDKYHIYHIDKSLQSFKLTELDEYYKLYKLNSKSEADKKQMIKIEENFRKNIAKQINSASLFNKDILTLILENNPDKDDELVVKKFNKFSTYLTGFHENRKNIYTGEKKSTAVSYRIVHDNLPKFIENIKVYNKIKDIVDLSSIEIEKFKIPTNLSLDEIFTIEYFNFALNQSGITKYNDVINGFTLENSPKIQGLNEKINLHCQKNNIKLPRFKSLYKQILSDKTTSSFIIEKFEDSKSVYTAIKDFYDSKKDAFLNMSTVLCDLNSYNTEKIYIKNDTTLTRLSKNVFNDWSLIRNCIYDEYDILQKKPKFDEKYIKTRESNIEKIESYSLSDIISYANSKYIDETTENKGNQKITTYFKNTYEELIKLLDIYYEDINFDNTDKINLKSNEDEVQKIKMFLDTSKALYDLCATFKGSGKEASKDLSFYDTLDAIFVKLDELIPLYNKIRNFVTQKPYSVDKIKLNFSNPTFLNGFDINKETANTSIILKDEKNYYLAIMDKKHNKSFVKYPYSDDEQYFEKMNYKLFPDPKKMLPKVCLSKKGLETYCPSQEIIENYKNETHKKGNTFNLEDCHNLIDYFKDCLYKNKDYSVFKFKFSPTKEYADTSYFYKEVKDQGYNVNFSKVSKTYIDTLVKEGKLYLFKLYNKDFSEHSKGTPNLHTMYFKALFDEANLKNVVYALNGGAEMFYRPKSLKPSKPTHPKNQPIDKKNSSSNEKSLFTYDLWKDKRFTEDQFFLHLPITLNFKSEGITKLNDRVLEKLKEKGSSYIIGIDRGERHLLYISLINPNGEIEKQFSLNSIVNEYNGQKCKPVNYHDKLKTIEDRRTQERKNWNSIENIKELKEGYISQVVHIICKLVDEYDAIIVMEDLNSGFKRSRVNVEKSVYQKFEKMLIDKLNYYVNKSKSPDELGGLYSAYQLTNKFESFSKMTRQNGIIFFIPPWNTSKIDPKTGFVDLLHPKYESIEKTKALIDNMDDIKFNNSMFEFYIDYNKFKGGNTSYKNKWIVCTNGERISTTKNKENGKWESKSLDITEEFIKLFKKNNIDYSKNLKKQILEQTTKEFFKSFIYYLKLTLQMRNSISNSTVDYLISPVKANDGEFFDSRNNNISLPIDADANGAYHIAKKGMWIVDKLKDVDVKELKISITNKEWLEYIQKENL